MRLRKISVGLFACGMMLAWGQSVRAADELSFGFTDLSGGFNAGSSLFAAVDDANTDGDVTRLSVPTGDAFFAGSVADSGFAGAASFDLSLTLSNITTTTADGVGTLSLTDLDGDTITADVSGSWTNNGAANFTGMLSNVQVADNGAVDGMFNGDAGSGFSLAFPSQLFGNVITLASGTWFTNGSGTPQSFSGSTTIAGGAVVPEPATLALLAIGGIGLAMRRRKGA